MRGLSANLMLALTWTALTGEVGLANLAVGFMLGFAILWFARELVGVTTYTRAFQQAVSLLVRFIRGIILASLRISWDAVTRRHHMRPGIIGITLEAETEMEITLLSTMISLSPGSLAVDLSEDRRVLYVHVMYLDQREAVVHEIKEVLEQRLLEIMR